jgi:RNA polymerase sigma factor (sigma-70 family)
MNARTGNKKRPFMMAMVLGTTLAALGSSQVQAQEPTQAINDVSRYCTACWRNARLPADRWADCTQEVFSRLLERVPVHDWREILHSDGEKRRELVRAIDTVKKRVQRERRFAGLDGHTLADRNDHGDSRIQEDRDRVHRAGRQLLSRRQQRVLDLSAAGWNVSEMAQELDMAPERVSDEKYKAIQKLRTHFRQQDEAAA